MSTYTKYDVNVKENLSRIRNPGNDSDGICEQRIIFSNNNNVYYGTFAGKISSEGQDFNNCNIQGGTIDGTTLNNVTLKNGNQIISLADLTSNVSEVSGKIDGVIIETIPELQQQIAQTATSAAMTSISSQLNDKIVHLENSTTTSVDNMLKTISNVSVQLSTEFVSCLNAASAGILCSMLSNDSAICASIDSLSGYASDISSYLSTDVQLSIDQLSIESHAIKEKVDSLSIQMISAQNDIENLQLSSQEMSASIDNAKDDISNVSNELDNLSNQFESHKVDNDENFAKLSTDMLSNIQNDKHYHVHGLNGELLKSYPYDVKDFHVNVIKDTAKDIAIAYDGRKLGYGYFNNQQNDNIHVVLNGLNTTPVANYVPDHLSADLERGEFYPVAPEGCQIGWTGDEIVMSASAEPYINVYTEISGEDINIGIIRPFERDEHGIVSGTLQILWNNEYPQFNGFIANIGQFFNFNRYELSHVLSNEYMIEFNSIGSTFSFFQNVKEIKYFPLVDQISEEQFGEVISGDLVKDSNGIKSIKVTNISLPSDQAYAKTAVLDKSNGFSKRISEDIYLSCKIDEDENAQFDAVSALQYYNYKMYQAGASGISRGHVLPDVKNESIAGRNFSQLSLHLDMPIPQLSDFWSQDYVLTGEAKGTTWKCISEVSGNSMSVSLMIADSIDVVISGYSASMGGVSYGVKYNVDINSQEIDPKSQFEDLAQSEMKQIDFSSERYYGDASYAQCSKNVPGAYVECHLQVEALTEQDKSTIVVNAPEIASGLSYLREFTIASNIKSVYDELDLKIVDKNATEHEFYELPVFSNGMPGVRVSTNKWVNLQINEISPGKFLVHDIDHNEIFNHLDNLSAELSTEVADRESTCQLLSANDEFLSDQVDVLSNDIDELWKNIRGGLNFMGVLSIDTDYDFLSSFLRENFTRLYPDMIPGSVPVRQGFFYPLNAADKKAHYIVEGIDLEDGDWLIAKDNFIVSAATSNDMAVFDAQDADAVRLNSDNVFTGHNAFEASALFNSYVEATNISTASLSVQSDNFVVDSSSFKEISSSICNNIIKNEENINSISAVIDAKNYLGHVRLEDSSTSLSAWFAQLFNGDGSIQLYRGSFARSASKHLSVSDGTGSFKFIGCNDYLIVNEDVVVSNIVWDNIDFIYDSQNESFTLSNDLSTLSNELNQTSSLLSNRIDKAALSIDSLSNDVSTLAFQCMHFRGDLSGSDESLSDVLSHVYDNAIKAGDTNRSSTTFEVPDAYGNDVKLYENDYIIFKNDISDFSKASLSDFNIIRDAQAESLALSAEMIANDEFLSASSDKKIFIDGLSAESLSAMHISQDDFFQKVIASAMLSNELYIVSSDYINAYGEQLKNLAEPTDLSDATTKEYVDNADSSISGQLSGLISAMYDDLENVATDNIISGLEQKSCISNVICAVVGIRDTLVDLRQTLSTMLGL